MALWIVRALFVLMITALLIYSFNVDVTAFGGSDSLDSSETLAEFAYYQAAVVSAACIVLALGLGIDLLVQRKSVAALAGIGFGLLVGLLIGLGFNILIDLMYEVFRVSNDGGFYAARDPIKWSIDMLCCFLAVAFIMQTKDDFRFIIPYVEFSKQTKGSCPLLLDTSVIIDGRIADIAATKIITAPLIVPRFILNELQNIADSSDRLRRNRGRRGLDMLNKMQSEPGVDIRIEDIRLGMPDQNEPVDHKLVGAAQKLAGKVVTNDYNLNKVASLRGVDVININDLANAMKPVVLPAESMSVKIIKPGDQVGQGVGYLDDGTMVVVEQARPLIHQTVEIAVTSVLQTSAGRMIFGKLLSDEPPYSNDRDREDPPRNQYRSRDDD